MRPLICLTVFLGSHALLAAPASLVPSDLLSGIAERGSRAVVQELYEDHAKWRELLAAVSTGESDWLAVAYRLRTGSDAGATNMLDVALFRALSRNPRETLKGMPPGAIESICSSKFLNDEPADDDALRLVDATVQALAELGDPTIQSMADGCRSGVLAARQILLEAMKGPGR